MTHTCILCTPKAHAERALVPDHPVFYNTQMLHKLDFINTYGTMDPTDNTHLFPGNMTDFIKITKAGGVAQAV
jgi:hypothetical protein